MLSLLVMLVLFGQTQHLCCNHFIKLSCGFFLNPENLKLPAQPGPIEQTNLLLYIYFKLLL